MADRDYEMITYEQQDNGVAWVTLNRPKVHNAFNIQMRRELKDCWRSLRSNGDVNVVVLTGAGERAFCSGIDRMETMGEGYPDPEKQQQSGTGFGGSPWMFDDPGEEIGPKSCDLWKPVIAAVNGIACGGAFYMLGEVEFIIASDNATFFDPHVTYGMTPVFEPIHVMQKMPFHEIMRITLLGNHERMSAQRGYEIGFVSEVVPLADLRERAQWAADAIASAPPLATAGGVRALWTALELSRQQALKMGDYIIRIGSDPASISAGQEQFAGGQRIEPRIR
ncbi:MAG TPA: enoyl-CoA hydratase/isomerase family protein [Acidimicrobiia bacterium]|nr:enoyl-CoA hydratase/isomerase family protein [Acidimicrobiia bacterium]